MELVNVAGESLHEVIAASERGIQRIGDTHHLAYSFLRHCGLSPMVSSNNIAGRGEPL